MQAQHRHHTAAIRFTVPVPTPDCVAIMCRPGLQGVARASRMRNSTVERTRRLAAANARIIGPRYAIVDSFTDHRALELGNHAHL